MKVTFYGHACFMLEVNGKKLLFDPFIRMNPLAAHIDVDGLTADYILLSHGHGDHVADAKEIADRTGATLISNHEVVTWFQNLGVANVWGMNTGGKMKFDFGTVHMVNAIHSSSMPDGSYGGNPGGFIIEAGGKVVYYAGDTALHKDMELIGLHHRPDIAILPIGDNYTMGVEDSLLCCNMIRCNKVIGVHYNTFPPIEIDTDNAKRQYEIENKELILMEIGESKDL
jgi:L-ascorbate metabolism protein UlaG (beta-lactamase superfamily)